MTSQETTPFQLSASLTGHEDDVRAITVANDTVIYSASRDKTVRSWTRSNKGKDTEEFKEGDIYLGHAGFVNAITYIPPSNENPKGLVVSGSSDKTIHIYDPDKHAEPIFTLVGHSDNVCALHVSSLNIIVSGSWDCTAKVWENWQCSWTLEGHNQAVWAVLALDDGSIVTGSADKTIRRWRDGRCVATLQGHQDCVRGLAVVPNIGFLSCSNDSTLRLWSLNGECLRELSGHTSFVYSIAVLPTGEFVSSGEDRSVRVWKDKECVQVIMHPCVSVWTVAALPNGDFVSGGSDNTVRVFTRSHERVANDTILEQYNELLASQAIPSNQVGDVDKNKLPGLEALQQPGKKDQQVIMVRSGDKVEAHQWSASEGIWVKIGEVVDAVGDKRKQLYEGKEYDYVFDVDIGEGVPPLKLPYNTTENPYMAAQTFINKHELPQSYLDEVAQFIEKNAGLEPTFTPSGYGDPFTGGSRYIPGGGQSQQSTVSTEQTTKSVSSTGIIPTHAILGFKQANLTTIKGKLLEFNQAHTNNPLSDEEMSKIEQIFVYLEQPGNHSISKEHINLMVHLCANWPQEHLLPVLDLLRLVSLHTPLAKRFSADDSLPRVIASVTGLVRWQSGQSLTPNKVEETNVILNLRWLANLFEPTDNHAALREHASEIISGVADVHEFSNNKQIAIAQSTILLNFAVLFLSHKNEEIMLQLISAAGQALTKVTEDEAIYRLLVAIGNVLYMGGTPREAAEILGIDQTVLSIGKQKQGRFQVICDEIKTLLK
ncbi:WD40-repeat-containing domain protein [Syncephalis plumigaleata]|nr:WD40-repeat-containing domain protein [Syncephalis plumigaleata]